MGLLAAILACNQVGKALEGDIEILFWKKFSLTFTSEHRIYSLNSILIRDI